MTFAEVAHAWGAGLPPRQKLLLIYVASEGGMSGLPVDNDGIALIAHRTGMTPKKVERLLSKLMRSGHVFDSSTLHGLKDLPRIKIKTPAGPDE